MKSKFPKNFLEFEIIKKDAIKNNIFIVTEIVLRHLLTDHEI